MPRFTKRLEDSENSQNLLLPGKYFRFPKMESLTTHVMVDRLPVVRCQNTNSDERWNSRQAPLGSIIQEIKAGNKGFSLSRRDNTRVSTYLAHPLWKKLEMAFGKFWNPLCREMKEKIRNKLQLKKNTDSGKLFCLE